MSTERIKAAVSAAVTANEYAVAIEILRDLAPESRVCLMCLEPFTPKDYKWICGRVGCKKRHAKLVKRPLVPDVNSRGQPTRVSVRRPTVQLPQIVYERVRSTDP